MNCHDLSSKNVPDWKAAFNYEETLEAIVEVPMGRTAVGADSHSNKFPSERPLGMFLNSRYL